MSVRLDLLKSKVNTDVIHNKMKADTSKLQLVENKYRTPIDYILCIVAKMNKNMVYNSQNEFSTFKITVNINTNIMRITAEVGS